MLNLPIDYLDDILIRLAHHSSAIEGNTISLEETYSIILHNTINSKKKNIDLREVWEVKNHQQAFSYVLNKVENKETLNLSIIKDIHELLTDRLLVDKGQFKANDNAIKGADFDTASPQETPFLMQQWVDNLTYRLSLTEDVSQKLEIIAEAHIQFERIHPFSDGNGRTGRMLINFLLLQNELAPLVIEVKDKSEYISYLAEQDYKGLSEYMLQKVNKEKERIKKFNNMDSVQIKSNVENSNNKFKSFKLKEFRKSQSVTIQDFAKELNLSPTDIKMYEDGIKRPNEQFWTELMKRYNKSPKDFS